MVRAIDIYRLTHSASELSGYTRTSSLTMNNFNTLFKISHSSFQVLVIQETLARVHVNRIVCFIGATDV